VTREQRFRLEAGAASALTLVVRWLPRRLVLGLGRALGGVYARFDRRHVAVATENLRHAFPDWDDARRLRTALGVYRHFGAVILDLLWLQDRSREEILGIVAFAGGEHVEAALARGRGFICATGHIGNWEAHAVGHGYAFATAAVVGRPLDNPALDARLVRLRSSSGNAVVSKRRALPDILRFLRANKAVAILMDQNVQEDDGIFVTFLGRGPATPQERGKWNKGIKALRDAGVDADGVLMLCHAARKRWSKGLDINPQSIATNASSLATRVRGAGAGCEVPGCSCLSREP